MKKIRVNNTPSWFIWGTLIVGIGNVIVATLQFMNTNSELLGSGVQGILTLLLGITLIVNLIVIKFKDKYFVLLEDNRISWFLEGMKEPQFVEKEDLIEFDATWKGIDIKTTESYINISFKEYEWEQGKRIRDAFKEFVNSTPIPS